MVKEKMQGNICGGLDFCKEKKYCFSAESISEVLPDV